MMSQHGSSMGSMHVAGVAVPALLRNTGDAPGSYTMGSMQPASQVTTRTNFSYGGKPMVSFEI